MGSKATSSFSRKDQLIKLLLYKDPPHHQIRGSFLLCWLVKINKTKNLPPFKQVKQ